MGLAAAIIAPGSLLGLIDSCLFSVGTTSVGLLLDGLRGLKLSVTVVLVGLLLLTGYKVLIPERYQYATLYNVPLDHVFLAPKPKDCDWSRTPLGGKGCHYEKRTSFSFEFTDGWLLDKPPAPHAPLVKVTTDINTKWVRIKD